MSEYLPEEVLIEIFLRLPIKPILRCTTVCKSWYALITNPTFISAHLNRIQDDDYLFVRHLYRKESYTLFRDNENFDKYAQLDDYLPFDCEIHFNVVGICNGILCLCNDLRKLLYGEYNVKKSLKIPKLYLWNPSIRKSLKLPNPIFEFETTCLFDIDHNLGFGFDCITNDYKVVRVVHTGKTKVPPYVELYKLSTGAWQDITHVAPPYKFNHHVPGVYVNGAFHWVASRRSREEDQNMIVLFDMHDETFREMMIPSSLVLRDSWCFGLWIFLFVSEKSLCFADTSLDYDKIVDIWMMKEYGDPESWMKQFVISLKHIMFNIVGDEVFTICEPRECQAAQYLDTLIAFRKNGELFWRTQDGFLVSYDPITRKIKYLGIDSNRSLYRDSLYVNTYKVSLVLLDKPMNYCVGDTCEESSNLCQRQPKRGRKKRRNRY